MILLFVNCCSLKITPFHLVGFLSWLILMACTTRVVYRFLKDRIQLNCPTLTHLTCLKLVIVDIRYCYGCEFKASEASKINDTQSLNLSTLLVWFYTAGVQPHWVCRSCHVTKAEQCFCEPKRCTGSSRTIISRKAPDSRKMEARKKRQKKRIISLVPNGSWHEPSCGPWKPFCCLAFQLE